MSGEAADDLYADVDVVAPPVDALPSDEAQITAPAEAEEGQGLAPREAAVWNSDGAAEDAQPTGAEAPADATEDPPPVAEGSGDQVQPEGVASAEATEQEQVGGQEAPAPAPTPAPTGNPNNKLFLGGLAWETSEDGLREYFGKFGTVLDCMVLRDRETGKSRGFGFVTIAEDENIEATLAQEHELDGRALTVRRASPKTATVTAPADGQVGSSCGGGSCAGGNCGGGNCGGGNCGGGNCGGGNFGGNCGGSNFGGGNCGGNIGGPCGPGGFGGGGAAFPAQCAMPGGGGGGGFGDDPHMRKIFLGGLEGSMSEESIRAACGQYGQITEVQMMNDRENPSGRGFGFVTFTEAESAQHLIQLGMITINDRQVNIQRAQPKGGGRRGGGGGGGGGGGFQGGGGKGWRLLGWRGLLWRQGRQRWVWWWVW